MLVQFVQGTAGSGRSHARIHAQKLPPSDWAFVSWIALSARPTFRYAKMAALGAYDAGHLSLSKSKESAGHPKS